MTTNARYGPTQIDERFTGADLDLDVWTPAYMPAWSSLAAASAAYEVSAEGLRLSVPGDHPLWCPDLHDGPLKVSAVQTGNWSGPLGASRGQQPFREGLVVTEEQPTRWGYTPFYGRVEVACRARLTPSSMFSAWMVGLEDEPEHSGEICIVEVFGDTVTGGADGDPQVAYGAGIHRFRDPALTEEFRADPVGLEVSVDHTYAVEWQPGRVIFLLDGVVVKTLAQAPAYPMQLILGVFDFPDRAQTGAADGVVPELVVRRVTGAARTREPVGEALESPHGRRPPRP